MSVHTYALEDLRKLWVPIETNILQYTKLYIEITFSPFNMTCLDAQESVVSSRCIILHSMAFWS